MKDIANKLHISTIDENAHALAVRYGLGIECAEFCWAQYMDAERETHLKKAREDAAGIQSLWFHAPFAELAPCAIDPRVRALTRERYLQAVELAAELGISRIVVHGGYIPYVYYPEHYVSESDAFWRDFLREVPSPVVIALENVMEPEPSLLAEIARCVDDPRLGLCLDIGHANCETSRVKPLDWIKPMAPFLKHVHIHDNSGGRDLHLPLGEGNIPMESIIARVTELCPQATFTIENMNAEPSIEWLVEKGFLHDR
ncbi:MAG: sugar phosphate isomerase/epimerase [Oscillospiraceae bacterium]|nr:sugar phosphate isomerase/epimerase [Oscillospiraceae bacterium]